MKRALISGGSRGIGAATVRKLVSCGYEIAFIYRSNDEAADALSRECSCFAVKADVSTPEGVAYAVNEALLHLGGIDVLVANAGISHMAQICDTNDEDWKRITDTNMYSGFALSREVSKLMVREHFGRIITVGSVWGKCGASCEVAYSASKAGIRGLTMALAKELGPSGITVNCVEPGIIDTDMNKCFSESDIAAITTEIPVGRLGKAEEVAELIAFLASDDAAYINGQCIAVDGGWCI